MSSSVQPRPLAPAHIGAIRPHVPGRPIEEVQRELGLQGVIKLASNENPDGPSPRALAAIAGAAQQLHRYPDAGHFALRRALARHTGVPEAGIVPANGTTELITLLIQAFVLPGTHVLTSAGTFVAYKLSAQALGRELREVPLLADQSIDLDSLSHAATPDTRLVFLANPNNPTGRLLDEAGLDRFVSNLDAACPDDPPILVLDEAYVEYVAAERAPRSVELMLRRPRTIILRTFSKAYGLAGLRCGYGLTSPELVGVLDKVRSPFNVNTLAHAAATAALTDTAHLAHTVENNRRNRAELRAGLEARGLQVSPSEANFLLVDFGQDALPVFQGVLQRGVITRPVGVYGLPTCLRISVGRRSENRRLLAAVDAVLGVQAQGLGAPVMTLAADTVPVSPPCTAVARTRATTCASGAVGVHPSEPERLRAN